MSAGQPISKRELLQGEMSLSANNTQIVGAPKDKDIKVQQTTAIINRNEQNTACRFNETEQSLQLQHKKAQVINCNVSNVKQSNRAHIIYINDKHNQLPPSFNRAIDTTAYNAVCSGKEDQPNTSKSSDCGNKDKSSVTQGSRSKNLKPYVCDLCQASFTRKTRLVRHLWSHTGEKPYSCNYCNKKFGRKHHLMFHTRTHTGDKPFTCQHCEYKSVDKSSLEAHVRTHTGEKPFACQLCNKRFTQKHNVTIHMRIHTGEKPYYCKHCPYKCSHTSSLTVHMRSHTGEKPYSCEYCQCKFPDNISMRQHIRTHTGEKFSCHHCLLKFTQKSRLTYHLKHKHSSEKT